MGKYQHIVILRFDADEKSNLPEFPGSKSLIAVKLLRKRWNDPEIKQMMRDRLETIMEAASANPS